PTTHDLLILAYDASHNVVVQRFGKTGTPLVRYVDDPASSPISGGADHDALAALAVIPSGTEAGNVFLSKGTFQHPISIYEMPPAVDGGTTLLQEGGPIGSAEHWKGYGGASPITDNGAFGGLGPQLATSPDGGTLYWTEQLAGEDSEHPGSYLLRAYSLDQ